MYLHKLHLHNYRNYEDVKVEFQSSVNVLVGPNGSGKTNLLDAIYYLSFTKSAFQANDQLNIRHGTDGFFIGGTFSMDNQFHEISAGYQTGLRKIFREDGHEYQKLSDHIGRYPIVMMAPDDVDLIKGGSEARRRFFDSLIAQIDKIYLDNLIQYNLALKQRNGLLRLFSESGRVDYDALESYDVILDRLGQQLYEKREFFVREFIPVFNSFFNSLVNHLDKTSITYESDLGLQTYLLGAMQNRSRDLVQQRTNFGVHKDDYGFQLGSVDIKRYGSQGQHKSFVIALKLTQWEMLRASKGFKPILLLDDIFDKLDNYRIQHLLELITDFGQLFITDARPDRTVNVLNKAVGDTEIFQVNRGQIMKTS